MLSLLLFIIVLSLTSACIPLLYICALRLFLLVFYFCLYLYFRFIDIKCSFSVTPALCVSQTGSKKSRAHTANTHLLVYVMLMEICPLTSYRKKVPALKNVILEQKLLAQWHIVQGLHQVVWDLKGQKQVRWNRNMLHVQYDTGMMVSFTRSGV